MEIDDAYDGEESASESLQSTQSNDNDNSVDTSAAWLLMRMKLSVAYPACEASKTSPGKTNVNDGIQGKLAPQEDDEGSRGVKRRRARSY